MQPLLYFAKRISRSRLGTQPSGGCRQRERHTDPRPPCDLHGKLLCDAAKCGEILSLQPLGKQGRGRNQPGVTSRSCRYSDAKDRVCCFSSTPSCASQGVRGECGAPCSRNVRHAAISFNSGEFLCPWLAGADECTHEFP